MKLREISIRNVLIVVLLIANVGCDQIAKIVVRHNVEENARISLVDKYLTLTKVENTGAFLGLGNSLPRIVYVLLMIVLPLIALGFALVYLFRKNNLPKLFTVGLGLVIGGGVGNIIDRILFGSVTDFLYFDFVIFHTGVVNFADISVTTGIFILIYDNFVNKRKLTAKSLE
jgi:signal peptidase II